MPARPTRFRPRLRLILALTNALLVVLPVAGLGLLRIYDNALLRQTEAELVAQGAFVAVLAATAMREAGVASEIGRPRAEIATGADQSPWRPRPARLELSSSAVRDAPPPAIAAVPVSPPMAAAGRLVEPQLREAQRVTLAGIRVTDPSGTVIATTGGELGLALAGWEEVASALSGRGVSVLRRRVPEQPPPPLASISRGATVRVFVTTPVVLEEHVVGAVLLSRTPPTIEEALHAERLELGGLAIALLGAVLVVALITSLTITRPVRALIEQARRAVRGERGAVTPLANPVTRELAELSDSVAHMATTLEERAEYIRTFASHVSHEFKTPLTAIGGAAELLEEHGATMTETERGRFVRNIREDAARLESLVRRLLELARADTVATDAACSADLVAVVARIAGRESVNGARVEIELPAGDVAVAVEDATLDSILTSLVDNAFQHGAASARIAAEARRSHGGVAVVRIDDDGPGIPERHADRVFEPFFTTARERGGTGLGLAIVAALVRAHHGSIRLARSGGRGASIELTLPLAGR